MLGSGGAAPGRYRATPTCASHEAPGSPTCARNTTNVKGRREIDAILPPSTGGWESVSSAPCIQEAGARLHARAPW